MRHVFDNSQVAHVWAQQNQESGRSGNGNFWFEGNAINSYHTTIARIVEAADGSKVCLLSSNKYSVSTGNHRNDIRRAIGYGAARLMPIFEVPFIGAPGGWNRQDSLTMERVHKGNLDAIAADYAAAVDRYKRARDLYLGYDDTGQSNDALSPIQGMTRALRNYQIYADRYAKTFGIAAPQFPYETDAAAILAHRAARDAKRNTPAAIAKRERERERKRVKVREQYRSGARFGYYEERRLDKLMTAEDKTARAASIRANLSEKIAAWYAGAPNGLHFDAESGGAALRIRGNELETSWGASVPLAHAIRAFRFLKLCKERGEGWHCNGHSIHVGHFTVTEISADGSFVAGCHKFTWPEIERVARQAGVFDAAPDAAALEEIGREG